MIQQVSYILMGASSKRNFSKKIADCISDENREEASYQGRGHDSHESSPAFSMHQKT